jgi:hypothetical protein
MSSCLRGWCVSVWCLIPGWTELSWMCSELKTRGWVVWTRQMQPASVTQIQNGRHGGASQAHQQLPLRLRCRPCSQCKSRTHLRGQVQNGLRRRRHRRRHLGGSRAYQRRHLRHARSQAARRHQPCKISRVLHRKSPAHFQQKLCLQSCLSASSRLRPAALRRARCTSWELMLPVTLAFSG